MKNLLYASLVLALTACGDKATEVPANQLASNDFESVEGWMGDNTPPSLTREKAHSGLYAIKVDPSNEFSMGYNNLLGKLSPSRISKLKLHAWVNVPTAGSNVLLITQITDPAKPGTPPIMWNATKLSEQAKTQNKWVEINKEIELPANVMYTNRIQVYLWRPAGSETAFLDDLSIAKVN
ncbi:hypothetical protein [Hymenobacter sp. YC55]|uniref:hypothetical protein n=1 Tax=Hymenobacter sp. YC55 TaxID=3034019 RepID=UPI0023F8D1C6|nr:hypothetical protein [Hymenobacter sp. YC55]MDF7812732.1 hypothetical protein [Hymenobacter sp. YC55]